MCTVTFIPKKNTDFIFTSSRDVPYSRANALFPKEYIINNTKLIYPKDPQGSGTWVGISEHKRLVCLLNGGFKNHKPKGNYRKSRGLIVKELLASPNNSFEDLKTIPLENIEPFTIIVVTWHNDNIQLMELVWTGEVRFVSILDESKKHIWSSATLYDEKMKALRESWFANWKLESTETILDFHHNAGITDRNIAVLMDRKTIGTVSISQINKAEKDLKFYYEDIKSGKKDNFTII